ncbi:MAG: insertion sequence ATP-binding protein y4pL [Methylocystaceae bacterium]|nr:MAG: insertion sequence ATP-binding protein y4pL [Methylocystaceae bacterium]
MLKHPTLDQLHVLGLYGMAKAFAELAETDEAKGIDRSDWLALLLDREASLRRDKRLRISGSSPLLDGYDEPEILLSSTRPICLKGADAGHECIFAFNHPFEVASVFNPRLLIATAVGPPGSEIIADLNGGGRGSGRRLTSLHYSRLCRLCRGRGLV